MKTAVVLIGFGGPESPDQVRPFLDSVLSGVKIPKERYDEVLCHYEAIGGRSPFNEITGRQRAALEKKLKNDGHAMPVAVAYRHSHPSFEETLKSLRKQGIHKAVGIILSPLRCHASYGKYTEKFDQARLAVSPDLKIKYAAAFSDHPKFIRAQSQKVREALEQIPPKAREGLFFKFTAHSIPVEMAQESGYDRQFFESAFAVTRELGLEHWSVAYQSRSGSPSQSWLEPDINDAIRALDHTRFKGVVVIPIGFVCDNVEVIYDLDVEAKKTAEKAGLKYWRASTVSDQPLFIELMAEAACAK